jgi:predicted site-specific integrase-resolvase
MPSKPSHANQPAPPLIGKRYVTIRQAIEMYDISQKTIERYIADGTLPVVRDRHGHVKIDQDVLEQVMRERHIPPHPLKQQLEEQQHRIEGLEEQMTHLQEEVKQLREQLERTTAQAHQPQLQAAMTTLGASSGEMHAGIASAILKQQVTELLTELGQQHTRTGAVQGLAGALEKRHLPNGTTRLVDFIKVHQPDGVTLWDIKKASLTGEIQLEVYQREGEAKRNKQEWWITREQHCALVSYWQQHGITYTACPLCKQHGIPQAG